VTDDAVAFVGRITAQGTSDTAGQMALWLEETQATAAVATTIGVLIALNVAVFREPKKAAEERRHHAAQLDALRRFENKRVAAQARKVVPSCVRTPMLGDSWWTLRIDNTSNAVTTIRAVDVRALDANGFEVSEGCRQAKADTISLDKTFDRPIRATLSGWWGDAPSALHDLSNHRAWAFKEAIRDTLIGQVVNGWPRTLRAGQHAVMPYTTADANLKLPVTIDYEDEAGYQWRRTDTGQPRRTDEKPGLAAVVAVSALLRTIKGALPADRANPASLMVVALISPDRFRSRSGSTP
jgi:hypothetical protein